MSVTRLKADGTKFTLYAVCNSRGDVEELRKEDGTIYARYVYDSWGNVLHIYSGTGTTEITSTANLAVQNPFRYRGYYFDAESGLYYLQSRYYDPVTGRFVNPDSVSVASATPASTNDKNLYAYCDNNPITRVDVCGDYWETAFDLISLGSSILEVYVNPADPWAWAGLAGDFLDVALPVSGIGEITRSVKIVSNTVEVVDSTVDTVKATKKGWRVGDDITTLTKAGKEPKWNTVRQRYWKNEAVFNSKSYSTSNIDLMKKGKAPKVMYDNGKLYSMELHHKTPKHKGGSNAFSNLEKLAPWDHAVKDPFRHFSP